MPSYEESLELFHQWTQSESLRRHAYAVEAAMEHYAIIFDEDVSLWRITGLLHDMDYELHPTAEEHPYIGVDVLRNKNYPDSVIDAIMGHALYTETPRKTLLAKTLFAVDELAGFITAVAYVRPTRLEGLTPKSVRKKLKDKRFAAAVSRSDIQLGAQEMGIELSQHIANVIAGMAQRADRLGLSSPS
ncbi:MAG: HDIG domain-containing protein [Bacteroidetes bacterium]|nr:HDIG domain-containing protein [Bacteroidota bacterium]MCY4233716.1 HDIG domain-containing protein [Bacteroidota bacterium]